jgi:hypothetical protein
MPKTSKIEYEKRVFQVQGWIIEGIQTALIIKQIVTHGWCGPRQAERLLKEARERWIAGPEMEIKDQRKLKVAELQQLKRSMKENWKGTPAAIRALLAVEKQIILIEGLNAPLKMEHSGNADQPLMSEVNHTVTFKNYGEAN